MRKLEIMLLITFIAFDALMAFIALALNEVVFVVLCVIGLILTISYAKGLIK